MRPGEDVAEACADALLAACAHALVLRPGRADTDWVRIEEAQELAIQMLGRVIERTYREGAKPR